MLVAFIINILIHVGLMALFLTIFFFTIAVYFEKKIVEQQVDFVIDDFVGNTLKPLSQSQKEYIEDEIINSINSADLTQADKDVEKQNNKITNNAWKFVGILLGIIFGIILIPLVFMGFNSLETLKYLFYSAVSSLIFVGITETLFLFLIAQNYLSADPMKIKLNVIENLYKHTCSPSEPNCIG